MNIHSAAIAIALAAAALTALAAPASACSCRKLTTEEAIAATPIVFEGEVLSVQMTGNGNEQVTTIHVIRAIKGDVTGAVELRTHVISAACGYDFRGKGPRLTIGASRQPDGMLGTNLCTMSMIGPH
jgi:TRAP-type mannitol/chloroaromatic compound transport system substrate-binding protein